MNRRTFLKYVGIGSAGVVATGLVIKAVEPVVVKPITEVPQDIVVGDGWIKQIEDRGLIYPTDESMERFMAEYPLTPKESFKHKSKFHK